MNELPSHRFLSYAAAFGALWGAVEITVGSFLHAMKIPFSGVVLAGVGAALMVVLRSVHPRRGVVISAGVVCAGIKMLSPAGTVLGPVLAILVEALVIEVVALPLGLNVLSSPVAGALVGFWSVTQKLLTQTLFYGAPILDIYRGILANAEKWLSLPSKGGASAAIVFLTLVAFVGACLATVGLVVGRAVREQLEAAHDSFSIGPL